MKYPRHDSRSGEFTGSLGRMVSLGLLSFTVAMESVGEIEMASPVMADLVSGLVGGLVARLSMASPGLVTSNPVAIS